MGSLGVKNLFESQDGLVKGIGELLKKLQHKEYGKEIRK